MLQVARNHGREAWYLAAALAGLRKGDLQRLTWADIDFEQGTLTVRGGKARREDTLPLHPRLAAALKALQPERRLSLRGLGAERVFRQTVTDRTRMNDFYRAGLAERVVVCDEQGQPERIGKGRHRRDKTRLQLKADEQGRVADLHALRTTLGTNLARAGVSPQVAQKIMRHSDYRTTLSHYTVLGLSDTSKAVEALPLPDEQEQTMATGTDHATSDSHPNSHLIQCDSVQDAATQRITEAHGTACSSERKPLNHAAISDTMRVDASKRAKGLEPSTFSLEG
ncbi:tyrosine-type recombinase/integrase [Mucisphaera sp.]|uniref:tyrosine-type recombinase/integrase n=1 Tax=Mucisphaera sp. TaxID=2913024 RepID=UPI003D1167F3